MKKLVFVALTMLLLLMTVSFSAHAEDDIQLCYTLTSDISAALSISGGTATCSGTISMRSGSSASMTMKLQQKVDNKWTTIATWTTSGKAPTVSLSKTKSVSKGYSYRVVHENVMSKSVCGIVDGIKKVPAKVLAHSIIIR